MFSKEKLRKKFTALRKNKYFTFKPSFFNPLIKVIKYKKENKISLYYPSNYEVDTLILAKILNKKKFTISLPKIFKNGRMKFLNWKIHDPLIVNKFGFLEPTVSKKNVNPNIIIVPLLAFDRFKNRLGYGKGYYDKFLSSYSRRKKSVLTIGLAFSFQKYKKIPITKSDIKLDYILTEKGIF